MAWNVKRSPLLPTPPSFHHPGRCWNCGHLEAPDVTRGINEHHDPLVGCMCEGGTKYVEDEEGNGRHVCSCTQFVPVAHDHLEHEKTAAEEAGATT